jgi:hypothetical protein
MTQTCNAIRMSICAALIVAWAAAGRTLATGTPSTTDPVHRTATQLVTQGSSLAFRVDTPPYELTRLDNGETRIQMTGAAYEQRPGYPRLPVLSRTYALPPGCEPARVHVTGTRSVVPGTHCVEATPPPVPVCGTSAALHAMQALYDQNRTRVYSGQERLPEALKAMHRASERREYSLVTVTIRPFHYDPVSGQLQAASEVVVRVDYRPVGQERARLLSSMLRAGRPNRTPPAHVDNADQARLWYPPDRHAPDEPGLMILTVDSFVEHLDDYVAWREATGFRVTAVTKEQILASGVPGVDIQQQIRNWLRANATDYHYLLIAAHHSDIPMRILSPWNQDPWGEPLYYPFPSDIYYGDLSKPDDESWDVDGDGIYGEMEYIGGGSTGLDAPDLDLELHVGRINASSQSELEDALFKIPEFESNSDEGYKLSSVLASGIVFYYDNYSKCDGAYLSEYLQHVGVVDSNRAVTLYEVEGDNPSDYACDVPLTNQNLVSTLASVGAGVFLEFNHGWMDGFARTIWNDGNGDGDPQDWELQSEYVLRNQDCSQLSLSNPNVAFLVSCLCGNPESDCIAQNLLETGSVGVVAHTRVAHAIRSLAADRTEPGDGGVDDLFYYELTAYLGETETYDYVIGDAVDASRAYYVAQNPGGIAFCNAYGHALYGDPALRHLGREGGTTTVPTEPEDVSIWSALSVGSDRLVRFSMPRPGKAEIDVWDIAGRRHQQLFRGHVGSGTHSILWPTQDLAAGMYILTLKTDHTARAARALLLR